MNEIPLKIKEEISCYHSVASEGVTLYPIRVREYEMFRKARPAIDFLQQSLPVRYLSMPLLSAYYAMDIENYEKGEPSTGLFARALLFLALSLRYEPEKPPEDRIRGLEKSILVSGENHSVLKGIEFEQDGEVHKITPIQFQRLRPILAAQNGIRLESDDANPELIEAERDLAELNGPELDADIHSLICSVSALSGTDEAEIYEWPILKLFRRSEAYERMLNYLICGFASSSGATFKGGNPVPSPFYNRVKRDSDALIDMASFTKGQNVAVSEGGPPADITQINPNNP